MQSQLLSDLGAIALAEPEGCSCNRHRERQQHDSAPGAAGSSRGALDDFALGQQASAGGLCSCSHATAARAPASARERAGMPLPELLQKWAKLSAPAATHQTIAHCIHIHMKCTADWARTAARHCRVRALLCRQVQCMPTSTVREKGTQLIEP